MGFDALARHYRWMEFVLAGNKLQRCRMAFLARVAAENILLVGEGNGRFLCECRRKFPNARITVVDASVQMLWAARQRLERHGLNFSQVEFIHANALEWKLKPMVFDLIVTHFFLDCFPGDQLKQVVANLASSAAPGALWLLADFQLPAFGLRRCRAQVIHAMMYAFFRAVTGIPARRLTAPDDFLRAFGFALAERRTSECDLLRADLWRRAERPLLYESEACCHAMRPHQNPAANKTNAQAAVKQIRNDDGNMNHPATAAAADKLAVR